MTDSARRGDARAAAGVPRGVSRPARGAPRRTSRPFAPCDPRRRPRSRRSSTGWRARAARTASPRSASSRARWSSGWRPSRRPGEAPRLDDGGRPAGGAVPPGAGALGTPARPAGTPAPGHGHPAAVAGAPNGSPPPSRPRATTCGWATGGRTRPTRPPGERPDLLVIGTAAGEGDPSAVASAWTGRAIRPRAVVLIETLRAVDRLRAIASGVDAVVAVERMLEDLPRYARTLAQVGRAAFHRAARRARRRARGRGGPRAWKRRTSAWCAARSPRRCRSCSIARCPTSCCWRPACPTATARPSPASSARIRASA